MAYKVTVTRNNAPEGRELTDAAMEVFHAYRADGRILHDRSTALSETQSVVELWFGSEADFTAYHEELQALESDFRVPGVEVVSVEFSEEDVPAE